MNWGTSLLAFTISGRAILIFAFAARHAREHEIAGELAIGDFSTIQRIKYLR